MPNYVRAFISGATFFFTVVTNLRRPILTTSRARSALRAAFRTTQADYPFEIGAIVVLPDHLHCLWTLPPNDADFSTRWRLIKSRFSIAYRAQGGPEAGRGRSRIQHGERGVWQRRFWEHVVRNDEEFVRLCNYIHINPVKHNHVSCPHLWPHSSFHRFMRRGDYPMDWQCVCLRERSIEQTRVARAIDAASAIAGEP